MLSAGSDETLIVCLPRAETLPSGALVLALVVRGLTALSFDLTILLAGLPARVLPEVPLGGGSLSPPSPKLHRLALASVRRRPLLSDGPFRLGKLQYPFGDFGHTGTLRVCGLIIMFA